jgi:hypothetical protein
MATKKKTPPTKSGKGVKGLSGGSGDPSGSTELKGGGPPAGRAGGKKKK